MCVFNDNVMGNFYSFNILLILFSNVRNNCQLTSNTGIYKLNILMESRHVLCSRCPYEATKFTKVRFRFLFKWIYCSNNCYNLSKDRTYLIPNTQFPNH